MIAGEMDRALQCVARRDEKRAIYRGTSLLPEEYQRLYGELYARGIRLVTSPNQFALTQLFPNFYPQIADLSFPAVTTSSLDPATVRVHAQQLGPAPFFIKDYLKSAKEIWPKGCVVPAPGTIDQFETTIAELIEFRGNRFIPGLVIRPLLSFRSLGLDPFGDECREEYRLIFLGGRCAFALPYGYYAGTQNDFSRFDVLASRIDSPFFTADCAITETGECLLLELGDGGCCGLPPGLAPSGFYQTLLATDFEY